MSTESQSNEIDVSLYSRQLYVLGHDAMKSMSQSNVLIYGLNGLGAEIAKNIILSGVKSVMLLDQQNAELSDLSSHFYLTEDSIGKNRAEACVSSLSELNTYVDVKSMNGSVTKDLLSQYTILVTTDVPISVQTDLNNMCREHGVKYLHAETRGVFGKIFCDFGKDFVVNDTNGELAVNIAVESIRNENDETVKSTEPAESTERVESTEPTEPTESTKPIEYIVTCVEPHDLESGDYVKLDEVDGLTNLNDNEFQIKVLSRTEFSVCSNECTGQYVKGGMVRSIKKPVTMQFKTLEESIQNPDFLMTDWLNADRSAVSHAAFNALGKYELETGRVPKSHNKDDVDSFVKLALEAFGNDFPEEEKKTLEIFANNAAGQLVAVNSVIGGFAAQEVLKACSGKFTPIMQFLYYDSIDSLSLETYDESEYEDNSRYLSQVSVFGKAFQQKIVESNSFIVGAGAIGCELLKNFIMSGVGCDTNKSGSIFITDMDTIEKSNLNRQFLFRPKDIGNTKSSSAANAIKLMNPYANVISHENRVGPETDHVYNEEFFKSLSFVANALDNVEARRYVDSLCVTYEKPLLESGTLGTKGNTQVIVPHLTESYGSTNDPPEKSTPLCTLKNFPSNIDHTIQYYRDKFEEYFVNHPQNAMEYIKNPEKVKALSPSELSPIYESVKFVLQDGYVRNYDDCIKFAYKWFTVKNHDEIAQLLHQFPPTHTTGQGVPFWTGTKRCPTPIVFDINNADHMEYILSFAHLWANVFNIQIVNDMDNIKKVINSTTIDKFVPNEDVVIAANEKEEKERIKKDVSHDMDVSSMPDPSLFADLKLTPLEFEKDDDSNGHIDFITIASNMRADNYKIPHADKHKTKGIAGKIIPAIATTTSIVAGLVTLEMFKLLHNHKKIEQYRSTTLNLALPFMASMDPIEVPKYTTCGKEYSIWDTLVVHGDRTVKDLKETLEKLMGSDIDMLLYGSMIIDSFYNAPALRERRQNMLVSDVIEELTGEKIKTSMVKLVISLEDENDEEVQAPDVRFYFKANSETADNNESVVATEERASMNETINESENTAGVFA